MSATASLSAVITGRGVDSTVPDNPGAVDATLYVNAVEIGCCTLLPDEHGRLASWGSLDNWADDALQTWLGKLGYPGFNEVLDAVQRAELATTGDAMNATATPETDRWGRDLNTRLREAHPGTEWMSTLPPAAKFAAVLEEGLPLVWWYNSHVTGLLIKRSDGTWGVVHTRSTGIKTKADVSALQDDDADHRWCIDLRKVAGMSFALRAVRGMALRYGETNRYPMDLWRDLKLRESAARHMDGTTTDVDRMHISKGINELLSPLDGW